MNELDKDKTKQPKKYHKNKRMGVMLKMEELYSICWNITSKCNEDCKFCYRKICDDNSLEQNKNIFDNLSKIKIDKLTFSGGEPLLYEHLFELVDYIRSKNSNIILSITTNGKITDDELLDRIIEKFDWLTFSLDSCNAEINEEIGRGKDHFPKIIKLLKMCNNRINIKINTVVNKYNFNELENIYKNISKFNISRWKILCFWPLRKGNFYKDIFLLDEKELKEIEEFVDNKSKENSNIQIHFNDFNEFTTSYFPIFPNGSIENESCKVIGNLLHDDILDILRIKKEELINHRLRKNIL